MLCLFVLHCFISLPVNSFVDFNIDNVKKALIHFKIKVPSQVEIYIEPNLPDDIRAVTTLTNQHKLVVSIGPAAFSSFAMLGSTLAHELEIHCQQNIYKIKLDSDLFDNHFEQEKIAERFAYQHEINNKERFGLSYQEIEFIKQTFFDNYHEYLHP